MLVTFTSSLGRLSTQAFLQTDTLFLGVGVVVWEA